MSTSTSTTKSELMNLPLYCLFVIDTALIVAYYFRFVYTPSAPKPTKASKVIEERVYAYLKQVAYNNSIPIILASDNDKDLLLNGQKARGVFMYSAHSETGAYLGRHRIKIKQNYYRCPYLLSHELGHFISITGFNDDTEDGADREAVKLFKAAISTKEWRVIKPHLTFWLKRIA